MSLFGELDVAEAADNPFDIEDGTYLGEVAKVEVGPTKAGDKVGMTITYSLFNDDQEVVGSVREWKHIPTPTDPKKPTVDEQKSASWLKQRMINLGVPEGQMNKLEADDLIGLQAVLTINHNKDGYANIQRVEAYGAAVGQATQSNPFA